MSQDLKSNFSQAATMLTKLFNSANQQYREAYAKGQKDMINEIVQFCLQENNNLKTIELSKLDIFLQQKLEQIQDKQNQQQQILDQIGRQSVSQVQNTLIYPQSLNQQQQQLQINQINNNNNQMMQQQQNNQNVRINKDHQQEYQGNNVNNNLNFNSVQQNMQFQNFNDNQQQHQNKQLNDQQINNSQQNQYQQIPNNTNQTEYSNPSNRRIFQIKGFKMQNNNNYNSMHDEQNQ